MTTELERRVRPDSIKGRAEAVEIIMRLDPEDAFSDCIESHSIGDTGDYGYSWNKEKLKKIFGINDEYDKSPFARLADVVEGMYWENVGRQSEIDQFKKLVRDLILQVERGSVDRSQWSAIEHLKSYVGNEA